MLAYSFWHWPAPGAARYEEHLAAFQESLAANAPPGFRQAFAFRHPAAPWLPGQAYLDWYEVDGFADLEALNEGAVSASRKLPHDRIAALAQGGMGGLYKLRSGSPDLRDARAAFWFAKAPGVKYDEIFATLSRVPGSLWMRQMVLGPAREFVLFASSEVDLPFPALRSGVARVWPP